VFLDTNNQLKIRKTGIHCYAGTSLASQNSMYFKFSFAVSVLTQKLFPLVVDKNIAKTNVKVTFLTTTILR
jgi:hypothetical protein